MALGLLAGLCAAYNAAAFIQRRKPHLAVNACIYGALAALELQQVARHKAARPQSLRA